MQVSAGVTTGHIFMEYSSISCPDLRAKCNSSSWQNLELSWNTSEYGCCYRLGNLHRYTTVFWLSKHLLKTAEGHAVTEQSQRTDASWAGISYPKRSFRYWGLFLAVLKHFGKNPTKAAWAGPVHLLMHQLTVPDIDGDTLTTQRGKASIY